MELVYFANPRAAKALDRLSIARTGAAAYSRRYPVADSNTYQIPY